MKKGHLLLIATVTALTALITGYKFQHHLADVNKETAIAQEKKPLTSKEMIGQPIDDFTLADANGDQRSLSEWQGKVTVLNFWATWCPPCREEIPHFVELQADYAEQGLQFVGIALQQAEEIRTFLQEFNVNYPALVGTDEVMALGKKLGNDIGALPYTLILDRAGNVAFTRRGALSKLDAEAAIKPLL